MNTKQRTERGRRGGFTLVEIMVVIVIIGLLAGIVGLNVIGNIAKAKVAQAKSQIKILDEAVLQFKMDTGLYPDTLDDLVARPGDVENWQSGGYLHGKKSIPPDPWNQEYMYEVSSSVDDHPYYIYSFGADGQDGGEGENADIYNVDIETAEGDGAF